MRSSLLNLNVPPESKAISTFTSVYICMGSTIDVFLEMCVSTIHATKQGNCSAQCTFAWAGQYICMGWATSALVDVCVGHSCQKYSDWTFQNFDWVTCVGSLTEWSHIKSSHSCSDHINFHSHTGCMLKYTPWWSCPSIYLWSPIQISHHAALIHQNTTSTPLVSCQLPTFQFCSPTATLHFLPECSPIDTLPTFSAKS